MAQVTPLDAPSYSNPFRTPASSLTPTFNEPRGGPDDQPGAAALQQPTDALTQDIDRSIAQVSEGVAPRVESSLGLRGRSGDDGMGKLLEVTARSRRVSLRTAMGG
ncbi:MAG: hypothetical protein WDN49_05875 [Acetobacteraceae bacterium]